MVFEKHKIMCFQIFGTDTRAGRGLANPKRYIPYFNRTELIQEGKKDNEKVLNFNRATLILFTVNDEKIIGSLSPR